MTTDKTLSLIEKALFKWRADWAKQGVAIDENDMNSFVAGWQAGYEARDEMTKYKEPS